MYASRRDSTTRGRRGNHTIGMRSPMEDEYNDTSRVSHLSRITRYPRASESRISHVVVCARTHWRVSAEKE